MDIKSPRIGNTRGRPAAASRRTDMRGGKRLQDEVEARPTPRFSPRFRGILLLLASMLIVPFMDAAAKGLEASFDHPLLQVVWLRMIMQAAVTMPVALCKHGFRATFISLPCRHLILGRGCLLLGATISFFGAIEFVPLADSVAITFLEPCFLLVLARLFLAERVSCDRWAASIIGFGAVVLIVKPSSSTFQPASLMALLCAFFFSLYLFATRFLLQQPNPPPPLVLLAYQSLPGAFSLAAVQPFIWKPLATLQELALGLAMGAIGACSHGLLILAFDAAEASVLSPLLYTEIIMQVVLGYACFGDLPDAMSALGIAIIVCVGIYIARQEQKGGGGKQPNCVTSISGGEQGEMERKHECAVASSTAPDPAKDGPAPPHFNIEAPENGRAARVSDRATPDQGAKHGPEPRTENMKDES